MDKFLRGEVYMFGLFTLGVISYMLKTHDRSQRARLLTLNIRSIMVMFIADFLWMLVSGGKSPVLLGKVLNAVYFMAFGVVAFLWLYFTLTSLGMPLKGKRHYYAAVPAIVLMVIAFTTIWTGWIFNITDANEYIRGPLHFIQPVICFGYFFASAVCIVRMSFKANTFEEKTNIAVLLTYAVLPAIGGALELPFQGVPLMCPFSALAALWVYINRSQQLITRDAGTGMNNRYQLFRYLDGQILRRKRGESKANLWVMMLDINNFKTINDTYGHIEGDNALNLVGEALKGVCGRNNCFGARFGGDEFVLVAEADSVERARHIRDDVDSSIRSIHTDAGYSVSASIGIASWTSDCSNATELVDRVDGLLYEQKRLHKAAVQHANEAGYER